MSPSSEGPFRVVLSQYVRDQLRQFALGTSVAATAEGHREALRTITQLLMTEPLTWGDPLYRLRNLNLPVFRGAHPMFYVTYAVDEANRIVYATKFQPRPA